MLLIIVLFVNQCLFIMDAITVAACFVFSPQLNTHLLRILLLLQQSININGFLGITKMRSRSSGRLPTLYLQSVSQIYISLSNRRRSAHTHPQPQCSTKIEIV